MDPKVEVFRNDEGQWYWHLKAGNGEIVAQSEGYGSKADAERGVEDVMRTVDAILSGQTKA